MPDYTGCTDLFAIAKAIARNYEAERREAELARDREIEDRAYDDEARAQASLQADWWTDFNDRNPR